MGKSIEDYGGLKHFLDGTKGLHNGLGHDDLHQLFKEYNGNVEKLTTAFGVTRPTMYNWLRKESLIPPQPSDNQVKRDGVWL